MIQISRYFIHIFGKKYFTFDIEADQRYDDTIAKEMKEEEKHLEDYRS